MQPIRTLIVDDEPLAQQLVLDYVRQLPYLDCIGSCSNAAEARRVLESQAVDLIFLDVQMPGVSGLSFAKQLTSNRRPKIVFTTAYEEYAVEGFRTDAVDYLLKPFDFDEFSHAVNKAKYIIDLERNQNTFAEKQMQQSGGAEQEQADDERFFFVKSEYKLVKIEIEKVCYIEGLKDYVKIFIEDQPRPVLTLSTLKQMEARLEAHSFIRLHRSYIVNLHKIKGVERNGVHVGDARVPIGDGYKQKFQNLMGKLTL